MSDPLGCGHGVAYWKECPVCNELTRLNDQIRGQGEVIVAVNARAERAEAEIARLRDELDTLARRKGTDAADFVMAQEWQSRALAAEARAERLRGALMSAHNALVWVSVNELDPEPTAIRSAREGARRALAEEGP